MMNLMFKTREKSLGQMVQKHKLLLTGLLLGFIVMAIVGPFFKLWIEGRHQLNHFRLKNQQHEQSIADLKASLQEDKAFLESAREHPATLEWIARKQLGYVKEGEVLFCFQKPKP